MRRISLILILAYLSLQYSQAQEEFIPETHLGIKAGGTIALVNFNPSLDLDLYPGFTGGLVFRHISQKSLGIQIEANYFQAGWSERLDAPNVYSRRLNYLKIPVMTHVNMGKKKTRLFLNLGPSFAVLLFDKEHMELEQETDYLDYYGLELTNRAEFALCAGLGFYINSKAGVFQLEGRGYLGMSNVFSKPPESPFQNSYNISAEVSLSYFIDL